MTHARIAILRQSLAKFGRPPFGVSPASMRKAFEWDDAHPGLAAERVRVLEELETLLSESDRRAQMDAAVRRSEEALASCGATELALHESTDPTETHAIAVARGWLVQSERPMLVLLGGVGTGKTTASVWALRQLARRGLRVAYSRATELARAGLYGAGAERLEELRAMPALVVDDLGAESVTDIWMSNFCDLVDARYGSARCTLLTSNLAWDAFRARYGERVADRLHQRGMVSDVGVGSLRRQVSP